MDEFLYKYVSYCFNHCNIDPNDHTHNRFVDRDMFMRYLDGGIGHPEQFSSNDGDEGLVIQTDDCIEVEKDDYLIAENDEGDDEEGEEGEDDDEGGQGDNEEDEGDADEDEDEEMGNVY